MTWAILLVIILVVVVMILSTKSGQVPWANQLRRLHAGVARKAEWIAPDHVLVQVRQDYEESIGWLHDSALHSWAEQWNSAPRYLTGDALVRHQRVLARYRTPEDQRLVGVMRADHHVEVRHFSEDGERCLIIDMQSQRRMATYDARTRHRVSTQDLGAGAVIYQMHFDMGAQHWKIEKFVQELPAGWGSHKSNHIRLSSELPTVVGRDH